MAAYSSVGSKLSVWCFLFSFLAILADGMFSAASCNSGFAWFFIVMCNLVYVMSIVVPTSVMFKSVCSVSFLTYQGASVISLKTRKIRFFYVHQLKGC